MYSGASRFFLVFFQSRTNDFGVTGKALLNSPEQSPDCTREIVLISSTFNFKYLNFKYLLFQELQRQNNTCNSRASKQLSGESIPRNGAVTSTRHETDETDSPNKGDWLPIIVLKNE